MNFISTKVFTLSMSILLLVYFFDGDAAYYRALLIISHIINIFIRYSGGY